MTQPRIVFAGTPDFALASLKSLCEAGHRPVAVYTQPDRPSGRGKTLTPSPVKQFAIENDLPVLQPRTLKSEDAQNELKRLAPDLLVVAAYGLLLPQSVLDIPAATCVNVHASALPRWRGAAPIQAAILHGDATTGISLMQMTAGLDEGPVYSTDVLSIGARETAGELHDRLSALGGEMLVRDLPAILDGSLSPIPQDADKATYAGKIQTADAALDWTQPAVLLDRQIRAFNPVPGCYFTVDGQRMKCWAAVVDDTAGGTPGEVLSTGADGIVVACGDGALRMQSLQRPGKGRVSAREFCQAVPLDGRTLA